MKSYRLEFKKFEILDGNDDLLGIFNSPSAVEEFFNVLDEHVTQDYIVQAFDENELLIDTWYMPDVIAGNFKNDVEKTQKQNK